MPSDKSNFEAIPSTAFWFVRFIWCRVAFWCHWIQRLGGRATGKSVDYFLGSERYLNPRRGGEVAESSERVGDGFRSVSLGVRYRYRSTSISSNNAFSFNALGVNIHTIGPEIMWGR